MDASQKFELYSQEFNKAYKYFLKKQSEALDQYYRHMYDGNPIYLEEYIREIDHELQNLRRHIEELRLRFKEILRA